jgi:glutamate decarboxylase
MGLFQLTDLASGDLKALDEQLTEVLATLDPRRPPIGSADQANGTAFGSAEIPERPTPLADYAAFLMESVLPYTVNTRSPTVMAHMSAVTPSFFAVLAKLLVAMNQNLVKRDASGVLTAIERQVIASLHKLVFELDDAFYSRHAQAPSSTLGIVTSGGSLANLTALWCARNRSLGGVDGGPGIDRVGLPAALRLAGVASVAIVTSTLSHYSIQKAASVLGLGSCGVRQVPIDSSGRIDVGQLARELNRCTQRSERVIAIVAHAGTTELGSVDPLQDIAALAEDRGLHLHVDAAWGGPVLFSQRERAKLAGIERADSVTLDGHKQLYLPLGFSVVLFRDPHLAAAIEMESRYMLRPDDADLGKRSLEGSRAAAALYAHAGLHIFGRRGYAELIERGIDLASFMAQHIAASDEFELLYTPELNVVTYRYVSTSLGRQLCDGTLSVADQSRINALNVRIHELQGQSGECGVVSRTCLLETRHGAGVEIVALRAILSNPLTSQGDVVRLLDEQRHRGRSLESE